MQETAFTQVLIREIETFNLYFSQYTLLRNKAQKQETPDGVPEHVQVQLTRILDEMKISVIQIKERILASHKTLKIKNDSIEKLKEFSDTIVQEDFPEIKVVNNYSAVLNTIYANELSAVQSTSGQIQDLTK